MMVPIGRKIARTTRKNFVSECFQKFEYFLLIMLRCRRKFV